MLDGTHWVQVVDGDERILVDGQMVPDRIGKEIIGLDEPMRKRRVVFPTQPFKRTTTYALLKIRKHYPGFDRGKVLHESDAPSLAIAEIEYAYSHPDKNAERVVPVEHYAMPRRTHTLRGDRLHLGGGKRTMDFMRCEVKQALEFNDNITIELRVRGEDGVVYAHADMLRSIRDAMEVRRVSQKLLNAWAITAPAEITVISCTEDGATVQDIAEKELSAWADRASYVMQEPRLPTADELVEEPLFA